MSTWTLARRIAAGFGATILLLLVVAAVSVAAVQRVNAVERNVLRPTRQGMLAVEQYRAAEEERVSAFSGVLLKANEDTLKDLAEARAHAATALDELRRELPPDVKASFDAVAAADRDYVSAMDRALQRQREGAAPGELVNEFLTETRPRSMAMDAAAERLLQDRTAAVDAAHQAMRDAAGWASGITLACAALAALAAVLVIWALVRRITGDVGGAVTRVQTSSTELEATATQQATASREQATATTEVTTTLQELLTTSRQIAGAADRVARLAEDANDAAKGGDTGVAQAARGMETIRRQVDTVVAYMLELGKKSQQVSSVLDLINELAEQTNILSINASIEAAGAGEAGRRFAVVAEEIRKLADRVGSSSKQIRAVVDDIRSSANTTIMATEEGSKAVDAGSHQVQELNARFKRILGLVDTTTEAAKEIELSTKQQSTAVEQVNTALANVVQAARETEVGSRQALDMSSQLAKLSRDLAQLVRRER